MKQKIIEHLENLIAEHEMTCYCTDWDRVLNENNKEKAIYSAYDVGRYETLVNLLIDLETIGELNQ